MITGSRVQSGLSSLVGEEPDLMILEGSQLAFQLSGEETPIVPLKKQMSNSGPGLPWALSGIAGLTDKR